VRVSRDAGEKLRGLVAADPALSVRVDLAAGEVRAGADRFPCAMPEGDRKMLVTGEWDTTAVLLRNLDEIRRAASRVPYMSEFAAERASS
jgi:3-isopropylmalate/(R)-2-methylmalate dehydratase small subunit